MTKLRQGGFLISKIHQLSGRIFSRKLKDYNINDINPAQGRILFVLWQKDNIPIQELAKRTALGKSTLTRMLDKLEETGHLVRIFPSNDRRKVLIQLTEKNNKMKTVYEQVSVEMTKLFYEGFQDSEIDEFEKYLERIFNNLKKHEAE
ncbi:MULTISPECIES: MarR family winged helix-turn-helix transcriptional regulator [Cohnella]|uniref:MarR family winged helix-turn-helix transcriptional regulator n=1 Tax=Cohnella TaxID=329857 RepID=UPI000E365BC6|nr:MarR family transcriptional regulator [Cohnella sp.]REK61930.1 MAG: MarR family transcriptional regulator [Cohnella sp.]